VEAPLRDLKIGKIKDFTVEDVMGPAPQIE
jgi:hypothetical protein